MMIDTDSAEFKKYCWRITAAVRRARQEKRPATFGYIKSRVGATPYFLCAVEVCVLEKYLEKVESNPLLTIFYLGENAAKARMNP